jgi:tripartite-type tricarboxylate transporter receptor subunit TctC
MDRTGIAALALVGATTGAYAQNYFPTKPVRILATEAGGSSDMYTRIIAQGLTSRWGRQVIVENRASIVAIETLIRAQPDGYSLLSYASSLWIGPLMQRGTYDPIKDVTPITIAVSAPNVLVVNPAVAAKSVKELIALAKAKPGALNYASGGQGSGGHLAGELFNSMAGINIVRVPFKGAGPATSAVVTGDVHMIFATIGSVGSHMKAGRIRALAVGSAKPSALVPDLPTVASVLPGYESTLIQGIFAPARMAPALVRKIQQDIVAVLAQQDVQEKYLAMGTETVGSTPEALAQAMKLDIARFGKVLREGGIKLE